MRKTATFFSLNALGISITLLLIVLISGLAWYLAFIPLFLTILIGLIIIIGPGSAKPSGKNAKEKELQVLKMERMLVMLLDLLTLILLITTSVLAIL